MCMMCTSLYNTKMCYDYWCVQCTLVGIHQGSALSSFLLAVVVDVITELARDGALSELLYADLVISNEIIEEKDPKI